MNNYPAGSQASVKLSKSQIRFHLVILDTIHRVPTLEKDVFVGAAWMLSNIEIQNCDSLKLKNINGTQLHPQ